MYESESWERSLYIIHLHRSTYLVQQMGILALLMRARFSRINANSVGNLGTAAYIIYVYVEPLPSSFLWQTNL